MQQVKRRLGFPCTPLPVIEKVSVSRIGSHPDIASMTRGPRVDSSRRSFRIKMVDLLLDIWRGRWETFTRSVLILLPQLLPFSHLLFPSSFPTLIPLDFFHAQSWVAPRRRNRAGGSKSSVCLLPRSSNLQDGFLEVTFADFARAVNFTSGWIEDRLGKSEPFETLAYFGLFDMRYSFWFLRQTRLGIR